MNIVVIGCGTVGSAICIQLAKEGHDVTAVDQDEKALSALVGVCDVFSIAGNGASVSVLEKAGTAKADLIIAVTCGDEVNILCCAAARKLGAKHAVARVRNPEYSGLMKLMKDDINLSLTINPELTAAKEIYRMIRCPAAAKIDSFCRGLVEMAQFRVAKESPLCGMTLNSLRSKMNIKFLVCSVLRDGHAFIPAGDFMIKEGDLIGVTAPEDNLITFFKAIGIYKQPVKNMLTVGGGRTSYYLQSLLKGKGINNTVIEKDISLCRELISEFKDLTVICDSGTNQELLMSEGIEKADAFLAMSDVDAENAIISMYAKTKNVPKIVTMISTLSYQDFFKEVGMDSVVSPKSSTSAYILRYVRSMAATTTDSEIETLHKMMDGSVEALEFAVKEEIPDITGVRLAELRPKSGVLIACIVRDGGVIIPSGDDAIAKGDTVIVITAADAKMRSIREIK